MWLCSQLGFFSIVRKDTDTLHVRNLTFEVFRMPVEDYVNCFDQIRCILAIRTIPAWIGILQHAIPAQQFHPSPGAR